MARVAKPKFEIVDEVADPLVELAVEQVAGVEAPPPAAPSPRCALEDAPVNSHLVILQWPGEKAEVVLQTPKGREDVPDDDLAWKLPILAELKKTGPHTYVAIQRGDQNGTPKLVCATAVEACQRFRKHFHGERD